MPLVRAINRLSAGFAVIAAMQLIALMGIMVYEVVCRFGFNAPNLWSYDIVYLLSGTLFLLGAGYTLREDAHVRIDFLSQALPPRIRSFIEMGFSMFIFLPILGLITWSVGERAWLAFISGQTDYTSPWGPVMWPFYGGMAVGLAGLWLQLAASVLKGFLHNDTSDARSA
jgi:TRAP-type mannitol/chloroaromatic compound transport system permease small subunit